MAFSGVNREAIWAALFTLLQSKLAGKYVTLGRHHIQPPALPPEQQPALFMVQVRETRAPRPVIGAADKLTLQGFLILYAQMPAPMLDATGAETVLGATLLNQMFADIDTALAPDMPNGRLTLGGLTHHCWIEGDVEMDPGLYTQQGAAIIPIKILVP